MAGQWQLGWVGLPMVRFRLLVCMDLWFIHEAHMGCVEVANDMNLLPLVCAFMIEYGFLDVPSY